MTEAVFPPLPGMTYSVEKNPINQTRIQRAASGRELRANDFAFPLWQYNMVFEVLRDRADLSLNEYRTMLDFFLTARGAFGTFLLNDPDDNTVTGQGLDGGTGARTQFQLYRQFIAGGFVDRITAPNVVSAVKVNGVDPGGWSVDPATGIVTFVSAPANGTAVSADFTYFFRVRFVDDSLTFEKFMERLWTVQKLSVISVPP